MASEVVAVDRWLYGVVTGDATLGSIIGTKAFGHYVPPSQSGSEIDPPYVFWTSQAASDLTTFNAYRIWSSMVYAVRLVMAVEDYTPMEAGAAALDDALHRASGTNVSGTVVSCVRESPFEMVEIRQDGSQIRHLGGIFRLNVQ